MTFVRSTLTVEQLPCDASAVRGKRAATATGPWRTRLAVGAALLGLLAFGLYLWAGYVERWTWTGLSGDVALWDWLEAIALPLTVGLLPLVLLHRRRLRRTHAVVALVATACFAGVVLAGYLVPWSWTGFTGNTLWDWLELALLPVVLATAGLWPSLPELRLWQWLVIALATAASLVVVLAGYLVPWGWTGFSDNKAWDWIKLLLLPVLVPTVLLPALQRFVERSAAAEEGAEESPE